MFVLIADPRRNSAGYTPNIRRTGEVLTVGERTVPALRLVVAGDVQRPACLRLVVAGDVRARPAGYTPRHGRSLPASYRAVLMR